MKFRRVHAGVDYIKILRMLGCVIHLYLFKWPKRRRLSPRPLHRSERARSSSSTHAHELPETKPELQPQLFFFLLLLPFDT